MKRFLSLGAAVAFAGLVSAQAPPPSFKAGIDLVRLDVRVTDSEGRPVRDLTQNEIEVIEDGEARPVLFFQHVEASNAPYAEVASRTVASEVSTNQGAPRGHLYVLVFDQQHITPGNEQKARRAAQQFLQTRVRPGDRVAAYALPGPGPEIAFTADVKHVIDELVKVHGLSAAVETGAAGTMTAYEAFQIVRGNDVVLQRVTERLQRESGASDVQRAGRAGASLDSGVQAASDPIKEDARAITERADGDSRRVLTMLADLMRPMRAIEGRKSIILLSEGFVGDRLARDIEQVAAAAAQSYGVIYAVDLNRRELDMSANEPVGGDQAAAIHDRLGPLGSLAAETDGRVLYDSAGRPELAFAAIGEQLQDYYLVGFTPRDGAEKSPGRYRRVTVRVSRPGVRASTRTGFALTDPSQRLGRREAIDRALAAPFPQQGLPVQYTTYVLRGSSTGMQRVVVSLSAELPLASRDESHPADVVFVVRSAVDGRVVASGTDLIPLPERQAASATAGTGAYHVQFEVPAGDYLMRAVVREPGGLVGSADRRFTVRALDGPALTGGDLVLSARRGELPVRPAAYTGDGLSGMVDLYGRTAEQVERARVTIELVPVGDRTPVVSGNADLQEVRSIPGGAAREARVALPLQGVPAGRYVARAIVKSGDDTAAEIVRDVDVLRGERPAEVDDTAQAFDPADLVTGAFARQYAARVAQGSTPVSADARRALERLTARDYVTAIAAFQSVVGACRQSAPGCPGEAATSFLLGWAYHAAGDDRQAISAWRAAAYLDPTIVPVHLALADLYVKLSQPALAVQALRTGLAALPQSPELLDRLSRIQQRP